MEYFKLFANCKLNKGVRFCVINDLQRSRSYRFISVVSELLDSSNPIAKNSHIHLEYKELFDFLLEKELVFFINNPESFPELQDEWDVPSIISNSIFVLNNQTYPTLKSYANQLTDLGCRFVEIRIGEISADNFSYSLQVLLEEALNSVLFYINYSLYEILLDNIKEILLRTAIFRTVVHSCPTNELKNLNDSIFFTSNKVTNEKCCGLVDKDFFVMNVKNYFESKMFNSCLNRKLSIDSEGNIKNCPSMQESYGNIKDTTLADAIEKPGFKKYWDINKDKIHVCKDCEFRYICTDCRAYVEDPEDILSKPLKCGYNPYTGEWSEWTTNPLKQKAIDFYGMREMVEDMNKNVDN